MDEDGKVYLIDKETGEVLNHKGRRLDQVGREIPDPTVVPPPPGYKKQPTMAEHIRQLIRSEKLAQEAAAAGAETFEEADDFDVGDDYDPTSPYEGDFDPIDVRALQAEIERIRSGERDGIIRESHAPKPTTPSSATGSVTPPAPGGVVAPPDNPPTSSATKT